MGIFRAAIDIALGCANADAANRHAFDQGKGIALANHAVGEGAAVTFVEVANHIFPVGLRIGNGLPFDAGWKTGTATAAKPGFRHFGDDRLRTNRDGAFEPFPAVMRLIIGERKRINDAATGKGKPRLRREEWMIFRFANPQGMRAAVQETCIEEGRDIGSQYRAIADTPLCRLDLDQRLQKEHTPRAGADNLDRQTARLRFCHDLCGDLVGANGERGYVPGNENARHGAHASSSASEILSASNRPSGSPSIRADGDVAQRPRQYTGSTVTSPSAVVPCQPTPSLPSTVAAKPSLPTLWQASPRQSCRR